MLNIDINLLRTFLEIEKNRHFGKAAQNLYLTQSAISARVRLMEETLGMTLFERHRNNIQLTPQGKKLLPYATQMVELWVRTTQNIRIPQNLQDLSIAAPDSLWSSKLAGIPNLLFTEFPQLQLEVQSIDSHIIAKCLVERTIDIGFLYDQPKVDDLLLSKPFSMPLAFYSNSADLAFDGIDEKNLVTIDLGLTFKKIQAQQLLSVSSPIFQAANWQMAIDYVLEFGGVALLPLSLAKKTTGLCQLKDSPVIQRDIFICYAKALLKSQFKLAYIEKLEALLLPS